MIPLQKVIGIKNTPEVILKRFPAYFYESQAETSSKYQPDVITKKKNLKTNEVSSLLK